MVFSLQTLADFSYYYLLGCFHIFCVFFYFLSSIFTPLWVSTFFFSLNFFRLLKQQLETDVKILLEKANAALKKYKMHMVIANELLTRKEEVTLVTDNENIHVRRDPKQVGDEVEKHIIEHIVEKHSTYVDNLDQKVSRDTGS